MSITPQDAAHALADHGVAIWGDRTIDPAEALAVLTTVVGDIARAVRDQHDGGADEPDWAALTRELGNLMLSTPRLAVELGLDPAECLEAAAEAQQAYVDRLRVTEQR